MDWLDFIASLVRSLAWPSALVLVAWLLRTELKGLLGRLEKVRHRDSEASFARQVEAIREEVTERSASEGGPTVKLDEAHAERPQAQVDASVGVQLIGESLANYPEAAVLASWALLEAALRSKARDTHLPIRTSAPVPHLTDALVDAGALTSDDKTSISGLRRLRNEVAHGQTLFPTPETARSYAETVGRLLDRLK